MLAVALCYGRRVVDRTPRRLLALAIVAALGAACSGSEPAAPASPTSAFRPTTSPPAGTGVTGPTVTGGLPVDPGDIAAGTLSEGTLRLRITGATELTTELTRLLSGVASPPPGGFAVVWSADPDATTVGIGGGSFVGTRPTSATLVLSVTAQTSEGLSTWVSSAGECQVTLVAAGRARFAGSFSCADVTSNAGEVADVAGGFEATG
ncbi:MAG TPA: hypothetical protein VFR44_15190 [Actinomycetota bacterium]|nr:hypothetical protein [Actinomycetota bacterium]